ncbi:hypothetical protein EZV62_027000 [Acer yangbiense]|uniref:Uncharacterized protein n=1 Tax=Acer yangbiense TaxID=1000413 RepID=A0A5C7GUB3_9ROSI|nr:hypothetical protein EZV62_027000 [Acer yangbiense]
MYPEALDRFLKDKCRSGNISPGEANYFFDCPIQRQPAPHMSSLTILFTALAKNNHHHTVISLFKRLNSTRLSPNLIIFNVLLNCICYMGRACDGFVVLGRILRLGFSPTAVTFNSLIKGLCREGRIMKATQLYKNMIAFGCRPTVVTCGTLIDGLCRTGNTSAALKLLEQMVKGNGEYGVICRPNIVSYNSMIDGLCKDGLIDNAKELFSEMKSMGISPDVVSYNSLIHGFCCWGKWEEAKDLIVEMVDQHVQPDVVTFSVIIDELCKNDKIDKANELLELMIKRGVMPNTGDGFKGSCTGCCYILTYNTLLSGLFRAGKIGHAMFSEMRHKNFMPDEYTYNIPIDGLCKNGCITKAIEILHTLKKGKFNLTIESYNCLLDGLCKTWRLELAWMHFHKLSQEGLEPNVITYTIMINGLCKYGKPEEANGLSSNMEDMGCAPNVFTYNTLMWGFLQNSRTTKVVELLQKMAEGNLMPDACTTSIVMNLLVKHEKYRECLNWLPSFSAKLTTGIEEELLAPVVNIFDRFDHEPICCRSGARRSESSSLNFGVLGFERVAAVHKTIERTYCSFMSRNLALSNIRDTMLKQVQNLELLHRGETFVGSFD